MEAVERARKVVESYIEGYTLPAEVADPGFYEAEPTPPTERAARDLFNVAWKDAYPGKRANSKAANAAWKEKREIAEGMVHSEHAAAWRLYYEKREKYGAAKVKARVEYDKQMQLGVQFLASLSAAAACLLFNDRDLEAVGRI